MKRLNSIYRSSVLAFSFVGFMVSAGLMPTNQTLATEMPSYADCSTLIGTTGDWSSQTTGTHHIPGQEVPIAGTDNVYYVSGDHFNQCLCPIEGSGIQTIWWNVDGMSDEEIATYTQNGWYLLNGQAWNLRDHKYLAKNSNYSCRIVTPTPTPSNPENPPSNPPPGPPVCLDTRQEKPTLLSVNKSGKDGVELIWSQPDANVEYYMISYGYESGKYNFGVANTGKVTSFRVGSLDLSKKYYFVVRSQKGCAVSEASNELSYPKGQVKAMSLANTDSNAITNQVLAILTGLVLTVWGSVYTYRATRNK